MMTLLIAFLIGLAASSPLAAIDVVGNGRTDTIDCGGQNVRLGGSSNNITLTGTCPRLDVTGSNNTVNVEALEAVDVTGAANTIIWQRSLVGDQPRLGSTGFGNTLVQSGEAAPAEPTEGMPLEIPPLEIPPLEVPSLAITTHMVVNNGEELSFDCGDAGIVMLIGHNNRLTLTGTCGALNVLGSSNQVWVQRAHAIEVAGEANAVIWEGGPDDATGPAIVVVGAESTVEQGAMP
jgi:Protein of unknown function (DUF3060)